VGFFVGVGISTGCDGICFDRLWLAPVLGGAFGVVAVVAAGLLARYFAKPS
jgi:hypothetical protein